MKDQENATRFFCFDLRLSTALELNLLWLNSILRIFAVLISDIYASCSQCEVRIKSHCTYGFYPAFLALSYRLIYTYISMDLVHQSKLFSSAPRYQQAVAKKKDDLLYTFLRDDRSRFVQPH